MSSSTAKRRAHAANRSAEGRLRKDLTVELASFAIKPIPDEMGCLQWVRTLEEERIDPVTGEMCPALKVDGRPFSLADRPTLARIFDEIPSTREEAYRTMIAVRKCSQVGFTVLEMLVAIYFALKFDGLKIGMFCPDMQLSRSKSRDRFLPIVGGIPEAHKPMLQANARSNGGPGGEGNLTTRKLGGSIFYFLWTSGKATTESRPMDVVMFDEVQEMKISHMEKAIERMSASNFKFILMGSTANWPDQDIDYWYKKGSQHRFHTRCPTCGVEEPLDDYFPKCIKFDPTYPDRETGIPGDYRYVCRQEHWIDHPQVGEWKADNPGAITRKRVSFHYHQMLSPTISPREMFEAYVDADDMKNFFNRKLGKPYQDPDQVPVNLEHLNKCVEAGKLAGVAWKKRARDTFMGIDQMGKFNVAIIKERLPDGRQAVIHVEEITDADPFERCSALKGLYGVRVCVVEQLPNFNDAHRFANRHPGRVFLCNGYGRMAEGYLRWGDGPNLRANERRTAEESLARYTVRIDQFKAMQVSLRRLVQTACLFPDPHELVQEIQDKKTGKRTVAVLKDRTFPQFMSVALVTERPDPTQRTLRTAVKKVGIDPHHAFANMLCDVAWARAHGTATFILTDIDDSPDSARAIGPLGLPEPVAAVILRTNQAAQHRCHDCFFYTPDPDKPGEEGVTSALGHCRTFDVERRGIAAACEEFNADELLGVE